MKNKCPVKGKIAYLTGLMLRVESVIFVADARASAPLNRTFQAYSYVVSKSLFKVWCCAGSNSHKLKARCWHGRIRRMSMTWTTLTSLSFLFIIFWTQAWSPVSSSESPHVRPFSFQEVSRVGMPDLNSGVAAHSGSRGSAM